MIHEIIMLLQVSHASALTVSILSSFKLLVTKVSFLFDPRTISMDLFHELKLEDPWSFSIV